LGKHTPTCLTRLCFLLRVRTQAAPPAVRPRLPLAHHGFSDILPIRLNVGQPAAVIVTILDLHHQPALHDQGMQCFTRCHTATLTNLWGVYSLQAQLALATPILWFYPQGITIRNNNSPRKISLSSCNSYSNLPANSSQKQTSANC